MDVISGRYRLHKRNFMSGKYNIAARLVDFSSSCLEISELLPKTKAANHIADQLIRSSTSPTLHYGEAQAAESTADFIHKMKICLKELRETFNNLNLIRARKWVDIQKISAAIKENDELISIVIVRI